LCLTVGLLLPHCLTAQDFGGIIQSIFRAGKLDGEIAYLQFFNRSLRQYAVAQGSDPDHVSALSFIEENWTKAGDTDVIDQWVIRVEPYTTELELRPLHRKLVERNSEILSMEDLATEGAEQVVQRIMRKVAQATNPVAQAQFWSLDARLVGGNFRRRHDVLSGQGFRGPCRNEVCQWHGVP
jgi:hypothetical protein